MPTYEYHCDACGHKFEEFQQITASPIRTCPKCGRRKVRRLIGAGAGVIFRGSGFYQTDYRSKSYREAAKKEGAADKSGGQSGKKDAKSDKAGGKDDKASGKKEAAG